MVYHLCMLQQFLNRRIEGWINRRATASRMKFWSLFSIVPSFFYPPGANFSFGEVASATATSSIEAAIALFKFVASLIAEQPVEQVPSPPLRLPFVSLSPQILPVPRAASARTSRV